MKTDKCKKKEKPIIGWIENNVPEEIIQAGNLVPFRVKPIRTKSDEHQRYLPQDYCSLSKNLINGAIENSFSFLDGIIFTNTCTAIQKVYDIWKEYFNTPFVYMLEVPKLKTSNSMEFFADKLNDLKTSLEKEFGVEITKTNLKQAISEQNCLRGRLSALNLKSAVINPSTSSDPSSHPRIMLIGDILDNNVYFETIRTLGGQVVIDYTSTMGNYSEGLVDEEKSPLRALSEYYLDKHHAIHVDVDNSRLDKILDKIETYNVEGVVIVLTNNCVPGIYEYSYLIRYLKNHQINTIVLSDDTNPPNQLVHSRLETFLEVLSSKFN